MKQSLFVVGGGLPTCNEDIKFFDKIFYGHVWLGYSGPGYFLQHGPAL